MEDNRTDPISISVKRRNCGTRCRGRGERACRVAEAELELERDHNK
jgi:hypothetical protein